MGKTLPKALVGKRIAGVVRTRKIRERDAPSEQLFLLFDDDSYFEIYAPFDSFCLAGGIDSGGRDVVHRYVSGSHEVFDEI